MKEKHGGGIALLLKPISPLASSDCARGWMHVIASSFRWSQLYSLVLLTVLVGTRFVNAALHRLTCAIVYGVSPPALWRQQVSADVQNKTLYNIYFNVSLLRLRIICIDLIHIVKVWKRCILINFIINWQSLAKCLILMSVSTPTLSRRFDLEVRIEVDL